MVVGVNNSKVSNRTNQIIKEKIMKKILISLMATISLAFSGGNLIPVDAKIADYSIDAPSFKVYMGVAGTDCECDEINSLDDLSDKVVIMGEIGVEYIGSNLLNVGANVIGVPETNGYWTAMAYVRTKDIYGLSAIVGYNVNDNSTDGDIEYGVQYSNSGFYGKYLIEQEIASIGYSIKL